MITLVISICATVALTDCKPDQRFLLPSSTTMPDCMQIRRMLLDDDAGQLVIPGEYKRVICEPSN